MSSVGATLFFAATLVWQWNVVEGRNCFNHIPSTSLVGGNMANTYTQLFIHIVFTVKGRQAIIPRSHKEELHRYITGIIKNTGHLLLAMNSVPDHIHILVALKPSLALSDLVRDIKSNSSSFVNEKGWIRGKFQWQEGFGAFSCSPDHCENVKRYIAKQEEHHGYVTFKEEYVSLLETYGVIYDEKYVFDVFT